jgi:hypothetical protein
MRYLLIILTALPLMASAAESAPLGRLFFTPAERSNLNILRQNSKAPDKVIKADEISKDDAAGAEGPVSAIKPVIMNGYISRSDGKNTLWVNDREVTDRSAGRDVSVGRLNKNQVQVTVNKNKSANLKPGQVYDPNTGKIYNHLSEAPKPAASDDAEPEPAKPDATVPSDSKQ